MDQFTLTENPASVDVQQLMDLYRLIQGVPAPTDPAYIEKALAGSDYVILASTRSGQLVGWLRAISDGVSATWIPEMVVHPEYQFLGLDGKLLEALIQRYNHTVIYMHNGYDAYYQRLAFYEKLGIKVRANMIVCARESE
jgi:GNAT superfamily N-acetyltransferase